MGNPFVHIELNTDNVAKAKKFYLKLFDWKLSTMSLGYTGIDVGKGGAGGGMQEKPMPDAPTMWLPYVQVDDVKKTVAKARKLGASVQVDYMEIGDMGAIGVFTDPSGAAIGVWAMATKPEDKSAKKSKKKDKK
ncbi:MAG TPA: VOC family protein [Polyangia bacterium]|jgi:predicted enzyme related to lactoylglutathione lyase